MPVQSTEGHCCYKIPSHDQAADNRTDVLGLNQSTKDSEPYHQRTTREMVIQIYSSYNLDSFLTTLVSGEVDY